MEQPSSAREPSDATRDVGLPAAAATVVTLAVTAATDDRLYGFALGGALGAAVGLLFRLDARLRRAIGAVQGLRTPFALAAVPKLLERHERFGEALTKVASRPDPLFRELAFARLDRIGHELDALASGTVHFHSTETWRIAYEALLRTPGLGIYRSAAWVRSPDYWQSGPGRQSLALNFELHDRAQLNVERIVIVADDLWPVDERMPCDEVLTWIDEQHRHAIWIKLLRESALAGEPDLPADFGIYGFRAVGVQECDESARTARFSLSFEFSDVQAAEDRWRRLGVYAVPYGDLLDQSAVDA